jgi:hypothetical protein
MEATATAPMETAQAQSQEVETSAPIAQTEKASENKGATLAKLLKKEKDDPNVKFSDAELDILDSHYNGKLEPTKPANKTQEKPLPSEEKAEEVEESEDTEEDYSEEEETEEESKVDPDLEKILKEVGAKNLKEAVEKLAGLKKLVGGRDAQAVAKVTKELETERQLKNSEMALWQDFHKGVPEAVAEMQRRLGNKLPQQNQQNIEAQDYIDEEAFIDPDSAKAVNAGFKKRDNEIRELKSMINEIRGEKERYLTQTAETKAEMQIIDEMVKVSQGIEGLKGVPNLRDAIATFYKGESNPKLEVFNELFQIAQENGTSLETALLIKKGRDSDLLIQQAKQQGLKEAYNRKPNPSLSDIQTGDEGKTFKQITEQDLEAMQEDHRLIPQEWYDKDENPIKEKIPKRAWKFMGL